MALDTCLKHHFLLAMPSQRGDYFSNTITYVCEHNEEGAMGFMVNRPMKLTRRRTARTTRHQRNGVIGSTGDGRRTRKDGARLHPAQRRGAVRREPAARQWADAEHRAADARSDRRRQRHRNAISLRSAMRAGAAANSRTRCSRTRGSAARPTSNILFDVPFDQRVNKAAASLGIDFRLMRIKPVTRDRARVHRPFSPSTSACATSASRPVRRSHAPQANSAPCARATACRIGMPSMRCAGMATGRCCWSDCR